MSQNPAPPNDAPPIDPPRKEAPVREPSSQESPPREAPPREDESGKPKPYVRVQKLRLGLRAVWWSAVTLTIAFAGLALWMGVVRGDLFALVFLALAGCCAVAGYGTLVAFRRRPVS